MQFLHSTARGLGIFLALFGAATTLAIDFQAAQHGAWHEPATWQPNGVPAIGDRVTGLGNFDVTIDQDAEIGSGVEAVVLEVNGGGRLELAAGTTLTLHGHLDQSGYRSSIGIGPGAAILFAPTTGQLLEWQQNSSEQRIEFAGSNGNRARIGLASGSTGHYHFATVGFRDSLLSGSYGVVEDAFDPATDIGWLMYLNNTLGRSSVVMDHIEFLRCGQIGIFGLGAGEHTEVNLSAITFRDQAKAGSSFTVPSFWFDGYGDVTVVAPASTATKRLHSIVSDTKINLRFLQGYTLEEFVLDAPGSGNVRANNNGGNALLLRNSFQASTTTGSASNLIASVTDNSYFYTDADNPHGWATQDLRGDAVLRNYWFEPAQSGTTDRGDAVLTNGPQRWVDQYQGDVPTLRIEHSGIVAEFRPGGGLPTLMTFNNSAGMKVRIEHSVAAVNRSQPAVALDENGLTPSGTGLGFQNNVLFGRFSSIGIGNASGINTVAEPDTFAAVDNNLYFKMSRRGIGGRFGTHQALLAGDADQNSVIVDPQFLDSSRNLASWDAALGGPGTAAHAIAELKKRNDDSGYNPDYRVDELIAWVAAGFSATNVNARGDDGSIIGPSVYYPQALALVVGNAANLVAADRAIRDRLADNGYLVRVYDDDFVIRAMTEPNNAILVSSTTSNGRLQDRLRATELPVLVWRRSQFPALGLTGPELDVDWGRATGLRDIELLPGSPLVGGVLSPGLLTVNESNQTFGWGQPGVAGQSLATIPGEPNQSAIFVFEQGAVLADSSVAVGKRIGWFEQFAAAANRSDAGDELFDRVVELLLSNEAIDPPEPEIPTVTLSPLTQVVDDGANVSITASVTGTPVPQLQWLLEGAELAGENNATISFTADADTVGDYQLQATNSAGSVVSDPASVSIALDAVAPELVAVDRLGDDRLALTFSESVSSSSVEQLINYDLSSAADLAAAVVAAELMTATTVELTTTVLIDAPYTLAVSGIEDLAGNMMASGQNFEFAGPGGQLAVALIVGDPALTRPGDREVNAALLALGYSVSIIDDSIASTATTSSADILLISSTVRHTLIGSEFSADPRSIVVWESRLFAPLGLTGTALDVDFGITSSGRKSTVIINTSSDIGSQLNTGRLQVTDTFHRMSWGLPGQGASQIAHVPGNPDQVTLFTYETDAILANGEPSPGRRIGWFATDRSAGYWTAAAETLFAQALQWAAGTAGGSP